VQVSELSLVLESSIYSSDLGRFDSYSVFHNLGIAGVLVPAIFIALGFVHSC